MPSLASLHISTKCYIKQISPENNNHNYVSCGHSIALILDKVDQTFLSFNPLSFLLSVTTDGKKRFQSLHRVLNNRTGPLFFLLST